MGSEKSKKECFEKEKPDISELQLFRSGKFTNSSESLKCYVKCISEKAGFFKDGEFTDDKIKKVYSNSPEKDEILAAYEGCKKVKGENECDTAFKANECVFKALEP